MGFAVLGNVKSNVIKRGTTYESVVQTGTAIHLNEKYSVSVPLECFTSSDLLCSALWS